MVERRKQADDSVGNAFCNHRVVRRAGIRGVGHLVNAAGQARDLAGLEHAVKRAHGDAVALIEKPTAVKALPKAGSNDGAQPKAAKPKAAKPKTASGKAKPKNKKASAKKIAPKTHSKKKTAVKKSKSKKATSE